ncbi:MAG TPA: M28 family peptidase [Bryobacteraceae bacterium]|nr:M28 family peptidase [Bryobacteraceae bacterium]
MNSSKVLSAAAFCVMAISCVAQVPGDVQGPRIRAHVKFLSSDLLEGRGVGTRGGQLTEEYLAAQLAAVGVKPAGENGTFFQTVNMVGVQTQPNSQLTATGAGKTVNLKWQDEFVGASHRQRESETVDAEAIFVGHGIVSKSENWDDYKATDVKGKVVVLFTNEPQPDNPQVFKGRTLTYAGRWTYKFEEAARQGALGCIIIHTTPTAGYAWEVVRNSWGKEDPQMKLEAGKPALAFAGWVTTEAGNKLLGLAGKSVDELLAASDSKEFKPIPLGFRIKAQLNAKIRPIVSRNVLGSVEGSDPQLKSEYVLYGAHWDHLGVSVAVNGDSIYNGAIDNATGCGVVLDIARSWNALRDKPRRSALFAFWTAEESGLRGAEYYAAHPVIPTAKTAININYDAIFPSARSQDIVVTGAERTSAWPIVQEAARRFDFEIAPDPRPEQGSYYRSDHFMLARVGIPAFSVKTGNKIGGKGEAAGADIFREYNTKHYHQPSDEFKETWDFASLEYAARFGFMVGLNIGNAPQIMKWNPGDEFAISSAR